MYIQRRDDGEQRRRRRATTARDGDERRLGFPCCSKVSRAAFSLISFSLYFSFFSLFPQLSPSFPTTNVHNRQPVRLR
ncbi:hypothetical protein F0562_018111 [Nyssa sinensis]|uniref:Uncharacterized protein n=1 Tax=Nyssa sinensis TaxID=561372 RepID=A0A5J4ZBG1_9ASTE|nr:hypothetical protein F0562_018111 [Nyssa sinensis]